MKPVTPVYLLSTNAKKGLFLFFASLVVILSFINGITEEEFNNLLTKWPPKFIIFFGLIYVAEYIGTHNKNAIARTILIPLALITSFLQVTVMVDILVVYYVDNYLLSLSILFLPPLIASYFLLKKSKESSKDSRRDTRSIFNTDRSSERINFEQKPNPNYSLSDISRNDNTKTQETPIISGHKKEVPNKLPPTLIVVSIIIALLLASVFYYKNVYESPGDCFVREMRNWTETEGLVDKLPILTGEDSKMAIAKAKAKALRVEFTIDEIGKESRPVYFQIGILFDYCKVK